MLQTAVSSAREQVLNTTEEQLNDSSINHEISTIDDQEETAAIPRPNYAAQKPEEAFNLDESALSSFCFDDVLRSFVRSFSVVNANDLSFLSEKCHPIVDASKEEILKWSKEGTYPSFVCDQMKKLPVDHADRIRETSKILYLHYLITFFKRSMFKRLTGSERGRTNLGRREPC